MSWNKFKNLFTNIFFRFWFDFKLLFRSKLNKQQQYKLEKSFRELEKCVKGIKYPNNEFNKIMSQILSDIQLFGQIVKRFRYHREVLKNITFEYEKIRISNPKRMSYPMHPAERENNLAIKIDVQSLFVFGMIMVNRSLLLLKMYLPDRAVNVKHDMYKNLGRLYNELSNSKQLSDVAQKLKNQKLPLIKWLYSVLRFYRNEFIEHLDKGYQQGMNFGIYTEDFALSSYKWGYGETDNLKIERFRAKLERASIKISGRNDGGRNLINRYYIQRLFDNIVDVPNKYLQEALDLIEEIGVHSPQPEQVIKNIENYFENLFTFMIEEIKISELIKYRDTRFS